MAEPVTVPPEIAPFVPANLRSYFVAFFTTPAQEAPMTPEIFVGHQNYMRGQVEAGRYKLMGPITDDGAVRGIIVIEAASIDEARALVGNDPAAVAGVMGFEVHPAVLPDLSTLQITYPPR